MPPHLLHAPSLDMEPVGIGVRKRRHIQHAVHMCGGLMVIRQGPGRRPLKLALRVPSMEGEAQVEHVAEWEKVPQLRVRGLPR